MRKRLITMLALLPFAYVVAVGQGTSSLMNPSERTELFSLSAGSSSSISSSPGAGSRLLTSAGRAVYSDVGEALEIISAHHVNGPQAVRGTLIGKVIEGSLGALDPHSRFLSREDFRELVEDQKSAYSGIGATIGEYVMSGTPSVHIMSTFPGSPARTAGLVFGDRILSVDGIDVLGMRADDVRRVIRGRAGSSVEIRVARIGGGTVAMVLRRAQVGQPTVPDRYVIRTGIGYIDMTEGFAETTASELASAIRALKSKGMASLILDLRGNPGGLLDQAVKAGEIFLPRGAVILRQNGRSAFENRVVTSSNTTPEDFPMVVLVNSETASAAEILAAALKDNGRATVVGERTFGKGLVQSIIRLEQGNALTLTTGRYLTPSGRSVQRSYSDADRYSYFSKGAHVDEGLTPDIETSDLIAKALTTDPEPRVFFHALRILGSKDNPLAWISPNVGPGFTWHEVRLRDSIYSDLQQSLRASNSETLSGRPSTEVRLRVALALAHAGTSGARRVVIEQDPLTVLAIEALSSGKPPAPLSGKKNSPGLPTRRETKNRRN
jgi:C-terminal peptidase prc